MTASCSRYNEALSCIITSPNTVRTTWDVIGWNTSENDAKSIWSVNTLRNITVNQTWHAIATRVLRNAILADNGGQMEIEAKQSPDFNQLALTDEGLFIAEDDYGNSYYFRGTHTLNNNVIFGGFQWKILRINGDGTIRLIYNGTEEQFNTSGVVNSLGNNTITGRTQYNNLVNDNAYIGYMYGNIDSDNYSDTHQNIISSTIKIAVDNWYIDNLLGKSDIEDRIVDRIFCNNREMDPGSNAIGYGQYLTEYSRRRLIEKSGRTPSLRCPQPNDRFSVSVLNGNGDLTYPVGLITADEVNLAGGMANIVVNTDYYLYTDVVYHTMTPAWFTGSIARRFYVGVGTQAGGIGYWDVSGNEGIRPVINLKLDVNAIGNGSMFNPYLIQ